MNALTQKSKGQTPGRTKEHIRSSEAWLAMEVFEEHIFGSKNLMVSEISERIGVTTHWYFIMISKAKESFLRSLDAIRKSKEFDNDSVQ